MKAVSRPPGALVPAGPQVLSSLRSQLPEILVRCGHAAVFAAEEFFFAHIRNEHTRAAYMGAVKRFLAWAEARDLELRRIAPSDVGGYLDGLRNENTSIATRKQHLAAIRHFFDSLVTRHAVVLNPALSVRGERYQVVEGKTPEIRVEGARTLLASIKTSTVVGLRDRAILAILIYTAARAGAVAGLRRGSFYDAGDQWMLHFEEKGGKSREIPVRHDLEQMLVEYIEAAGIRDSGRDTPLFRTAVRKTGRLTETGRGRLPVNEATTEGRAPALASVAAFVPCDDNYRLARTGRTTRRRTASRRPLGPTDYPPLRPARPENHSQHRRADFDLNG